jgi:outer membrane protein
MKLAVTLFSTALALAAELSATPPIDLDEAVAMVRTQNLEIKAADYDLQSARTDANIADGYHWGRVDFTQDVARSNDAGNVFGFKLTSREASFGDFGFSEFLAPLGGALMLASNDALTPTDLQNMGSLLQVQPEDLNYPDTRTFFQSKLSYQVPLYVGGKLSAYSRITETMETIKSLDKDQVIDEKIYQVRKSFYDMALLNSSLEHFGKILENIRTLETTTETMLQEGYAKNTDLLEVQAKRANVERMINEMHSNKELLYHFISFLLNRDITAIETPEVDVPMCAKSDEEVLAHNLDLKKAAKGLEITDEMLTVSRSGFLPQVGAFAEIATADNSFLGDASDHKAYTVGARLSWNLFNGAIDANELEKAKVGHLKMQTQVALAKKGIALKLHQIRTEIKKHDYEIASLDKELELANEIYESYAARYREHLASMSDVLIKQSQQIEKILALQMAKNKRNERVFALQRLANGEKL